MKSSPYTILIVEDNARIRDVMKMGFELEGYLVRTATDGNDALKSLENFPLPDLMVIDLMMPKLNGFQLLELVKGNSDHPASKIPVLVISAVANASRDQLPQADEVLPKPVDIDHLFERVRHYCP